MRKVHRYIACFDKKTERLVAQIGLRGVKLRSLRQLFHAPATDPMYECFPIGPTEAQALARYTTRPLNLKKYDCFLDCEA